MPKLSPTYIIIEFDDTVTTNTVDHVQAALLKDPNHWAFTYKEMRVAYDDGFGHLVTTDPPDYKEGD